MPCPSIRAYAPAFHSIRIRRKSAPGHQMAIAEKGFINYLNEVEASALSDNFWQITLPQNLETSSVNSPAFNTFIAAQINLNCNSMLMNGTKVLTWLLFQVTCTTFFLGLILKKPA